MKDLERIRAFARTVLREYVSACGAAGEAASHHEASRATVANELLDLLDSLPAPAPVTTEWDLAIDGDDATGPTTRRLRVPGGWLYQVEHHMQIEPIEARPGQNCYGWHAPVFVPEVRS